MHVAHDTLGFETDSVLVGGASICAQLILCTTGLSKGLTRMIRCEMRMHTIAERGSQMFGLQEHADPW